MAAAVGFVCLPTIGCSWIFVQRPPPGPIQATPPIECESSTAAPVFDTVGAVVVGVGGILVTIFGLTLDTAPCEGFDVFCSSPQTKATTIAAGVAAMGAAVALGFSADYGYSAIQECRSRQDVQLQLSCASGVEDACRTLQERKPK
jgi:hypothetical protein